MCFSVLICVMCVTAEPQAGEVDMSAMLCWLDCITPRAALGALPGAPGRPRVGACPGQTAQCSWFAETPAWGSDCAEPVPELEHRIALIPSMPVRAGMTATRIACHCVLFWHQSLALQCHVQCKSWQARARTRSDIAILRGMSDCGQPCGSATTPCVIQHYSNDRGW